MNQYRKQRIRSLLNMLTIALALSALMACGAPSQTSTPPQVVLSIATIIPTQTTPLPPGIATHQAFATRNAQRLSQVRTEVALTPTEPRPTLGPWPTPTVRLGMHECVNANTMDPQMANCWIGVVNGEFMGVAGGFEGSFDDPNQGLVMVFHGRLFSSTDPTTEIYRTPQRIGPVRIVSVNGTLFTLAPIDFSTPGAVLTPWATQTPGILFIFDLSTRQWVNP